MDRIYTRLRGIAANRPELLPIIQPMIRQARNDPRYARQLAKQAAQVQGQGGAGFLFVCSEDATILLLRRSSVSEDGNVWGLPGGTMGGDAQIDDHNPSIPKFPLSAYHTHAVQEVKNNLGSFPKSKPVDSVVYHSGNWKYIVFVAEVTAEEKAKWHFMFKDKENTKAEWFSGKDLPSPLHFVTKFTFKYFTPPNAPVAPKVKVPKAPKAPAPTPPPAVVQAPEPVVVPPKAPEPIVAPVVTQAPVAPVVTQAPTNPQPGSLTVTLADLNNAKTGHVVAFTASNGSNLTWAKKGINQWVVPALPGPTHSTDYAFKTLLKAKKILSSQVPVEAPKPPPLQVPEAPKAPEPTPMVKAPEPLPEPVKPALKIPTLDELKAAPLHSTLSWTKNTIPHNAIKSTKSSWVYSIDGKVSDTWSAGYIVDMMSEADASPVLKIPAGEIPAIEPIKPSVQLPTKEGLDAVGEYTQLTWTTNQGAVKWRAVKQYSGVWNLSKNNLPSMTNDSVKVIEVLQSADASPEWTIVAAPPKPVKLPSEAEMNAAPPGSTLVWAKDSNLVYKAQKLPQVLSWGIWINGSFQGNRDTSDTRDLAAKAVTDPIFTVAPVPSVKLPSEAALTAAPSGSTLTWSDGFQATKGPHGAWSIKITNTFVESTNVLGVLTSAAKSSTDPVLMLAPTPQPIPVTPPPVTPPPVADAISLAALLAAKEGHVVKYVTTKGTINSWTKYEKGQWRATPGASPHSSAYVIKRLQEAKKVLFSIPPDSLKIPTLDDLSAAADGSVMTWKQGTSDWLAFKREGDEWSLKQGDSGSFYGTSGPDLVYRLKSADTSPVLMKPSWKLPSATELKTAPLDTQLTWTTQNGAQKWEALRVGDSTWKISRNGQHQATEDGSDLTLKMIGSDAAPVLTLPPPEDESAEASAVFPTEVIKSTVPSLTDLNNAPPGSTITYTSSGSPIVYTKSPDGNWKSPEITTRTPGFVAAMLDETSVPSFPVSSKPLYFGVPTPAEIKGAGPGSTITIGTRKYVKSSDLGEWWIRGSNYASSNYDVVSAVTNTEGRIVQTDFLTATSVPVTESGFTVDVTKNRALLNKLPVGSVIQYQQNVNFTLLKTIKGDFEVKRSQSYGDTSEGVKSPLAAARLLAELMAPENKAKSRVMLQQGSTKPFETGPAGGFVAEKNVNEAALKKLPVGSDIELYIGGKKYRFAIGLNDISVFVNQSKQTTVTSAMAAKILSDAVNRGEKITVIKSVPPPTVEELDKAPDYSSVIIKNSIYVTESRYTKLEDGLWRKKGSEMISPEMLVQRIATEMGNGGKIQVNFEVTSAKVIPLNPTIAGPIQVSEGFKPKMSQLEGIDLAEIKSAIPGNTFVLKTAKGTVQFYTRKAGGWQRAGNNLTKFTNEQFQEVLNKFLKRGDTVGTRSYETEPPKVEAPPKVDPYKYVVQFGIADAIDQYVAKHQELFKTAEAVGVSDIQDHLEAIRYVAEHGNLGEYGSSFKPPSHITTKFQSGRTYPTHEARISYDHLVNEVSKDKKKLGIILQGYRVGLSYMKDLKKNKPDLYSKHKSYMNTWRGNSGNLWCLQAYCQQRGMSAWDVDENERDLKQQCLENEKQLMDDAVYFNEVYTFTQAYFKWAGVKTVTLFRGVNYQLATKPPKVGDPCLIPSRSLTSWSGEPGIAARFGRIVRAEVPVEHIFASPITDPRFGQAEVKFTNSESNLEHGWETEFVVMGASDIVAYVVSDIRITKSKDYDGSETYSADNTSWKDPYSGVWKAPELKMATVRGQEVYMLEQDADNDNWMQILRAEENLRKQTLKFAQERPEFRRHLLPLLRKTR